MLLKNAPILVLDEATSALDLEVEGAIQQNLERLMHGRTVIAIAHRLSTIAHLDRLVVMDKGKIVEDGTHQALLARGGLYAELWARQSGGFIARRRAKARRTPRRIAGGGTRGRPHVVKQVDCGIDIINDGEQGRTDYTVHVLKRLTG